MKSAIYFFESRVDTMLQETCFEYPAEVQSERQVVMVGRSAEARPSAEDRPEQVSMSLTTLLQYVSFSNPKLVICVSVTSIASDPDELRLGTAPWT